MRLPVLCSAATSLELSRAHCCACCPRQVVSNTVADGQRTVTLTRARKGAGPQYYSFDFDGPSRIPFIDAVGSGPNFAYHKAKTPSAITLLPVAAPACVCSGSKLEFGDGAPSMTSLLKHSPRH